MYYCNIKKSDIADGPGVRVTLFVSGCTHHCEECFQPETWNFTYGQPFTKEVEEELMEALRPGYVAGLTLLGGEPFEPEHQYVLLSLLQRVRREFPQKTIWAYSGYVYEELSGKEVGTGRLSFPFPCHRYGYGSNRQPRSGSPTGNHADDTGGTGAFDPFLHRSAQQSRSRPQRPKKPVKSYGGSRNKSVYRYL